MVWTWHFYDSHCSTSMSDLSSMLWSSGCTFQTHISTQYSYRHFKVYRSQIEPILPFKPTHLFCHQACSFFDATHPTHTVSVALLTFSLEVSSSCCTVPSPSSPSCHQALKILNSYVCLIFIYSCTAAILVHVLFTFWLDSYRVWSPNLQICCQGSLPKLQT